MPSQIAVLDAEGVILKVNRAWREFALENSGPRSLADGVGNNYLEVCRGADGKRAAEAPAAYAGIRSVLDGEQDEFILEYPCHSAARQRWFMMTVTPFIDTDGRVVISHLNITERKLAELQRSSLNEIIENSINEIYIFDDETLRFIYVNQGARDNLGYSMEEMHRLTAVDIKPEFTLEAFEQEIRPLRDNEREKIEFQTVHQRKDGKTYPVEVHLQRSAFESKPVFLAIILDITKRQQAEFQRTSLNDILERSTNEIYIFDAETLHFIHANHGALNNLGYGLDELQELTPIDIKPEFTLAAFRAMLAPLRDNLKKKIDFTTVHERKDGTTYPVEVHAQRTMFDSKPVYTQIILDITERTQTEEALAQSRLFLESAPDASIIVNSNGDIEVANSRVTALFGYTADELRGMPVEVLVPERFRGGHVAHREAFTEDPKVRGMGADLDLFAVAKDGREIPIEVSLSPIQTGDGQLVAAAIRDVTARKEAASILAEAKEMAESATATKTRFLAAASHDLRQPLQSIALYLSVLDRQSNPSEKTQEINGKIRSSLDVMGELLDALLDISQLDGGSIIPTKKDFTVQSMLDRIVADNEPAANAKGLDLRCSASPCVLHSDPALLQRVVENFVTNAIRYTDSGHIEVTCEPRVDTCRIEVKDTGVGMPAESLDTIFEEYFQLDNPVRDRRKGLGLGLAIVKHLTHLLDHTLDVQSTLGEGSTFAVDVPIGQPIEESLESSTKVGSPAHTKQRQTIVLFVDDDPAIVDATTMLLDVAGISVHSALDGDAALAHIEAGVRPDVIISDYRLPGYNGVEVVRRVRQATTSDLPTVLMTGDTSSKEIDDAGLGNCTVLHKPVDTDHLISLIESFTA
jgi:PAS domain S-box-containing protein